MTIDVLKKQLETQLALVQNWEMIPTKEGDVQLLENVSLREKMDRLRSGITAATLRQQEMKKVVTEVDLKRERKMAQISQFELEIQKAIEEADQAIKTIEELDAFKSSSLLTSTKSGFETSRSTFNQLHRKEREIFTKADNYLCRLYFFINSCDGETQCHHQ